MYSQNEINAVELSPTKKDYYQVWNELVDVAGKLSERWSPASTNESDPGIVLLKVLTAVADKLSYNIDANTLEAFMPSAAQDSSMRKLCDMLGYNMRFYKSATTRARITYHGDAFPSETSIRIEKFTNLKNVDNTINYLTLEDVVLSPTKRSQVIECIEGELVSCTTNVGNRILFEHLDDNFRFYFPEYRVASNKVLVAQADTPNKYWKLVDNLNTCSLGESVFKFGFDSSRGLPYIQFPEDVSSLIGTGLQIQFIRTKGVSGNIAVSTLKTLEKPLSWSQTATSDEVDSELLIEGTSDTEDWKDVTLYTVTNLSAARDGKDPETIDEAYWNFQKTVGTFDTLVTCRDYMNKIYNLTVSDTSAAALISNIIVSDIRDDINRAYTLSTLTAQGTANKYRAHKHSDTGEDKIHYFDLMLYPFVAVNGLNSKTEYINSFTYTNQQTADIIAALEEQKTLAHNFESPNLDEIACVKVYYQLSARLATTERVSALEATEIELQAQKALYKEFNARNMAFGEELPFDLILKALLNASTKIKNVNLDDPKTYITVCTASGKEYPITGDYIFTDLADAEKARQYYLDLTLRNVLAGRIPLFNYDNTFSATLDCETYPAGAASTSTTASKLLINPNGKSETLLVFKDSDDAKSVSYKLLGTENTGNYLVNSKGFASKCLAFPSIDPGVCTIKLSIPEDTQEAQYTLSEVVSGIAELQIETFAPGAANAAHIIRYRPSFDNANGNLIKFSAVLDKSGTNKTPDFFFASTFIFDDFEDHQKRDITLCRIPLNNTACETLDKVTVRLLVNSQKELKKLEAATIDFVWSTETSPNWRSFTETSNFNDLNTRNAFDLNSTLEGNTQPDSAAYLIAVPNDAAKTSRELKFNADTLSCEPGSLRTLKLYRAGEIPLMPRDAHAYELSLNDGTNSREIIVTFSEGDSESLGTLNCDGSSWSFQSRYGGGSLRIGGGSSADEFSIKDNIIDLNGKKALEFKICSLGFSVEVSNIGSSDDPGLHTHLFDEFIAADTFAAIQCVKCVGDKSITTKTVTANEIIGNNEILEFIFGMSNSDVFTDEIKISLSKTGISQVTISPESPESPSSETSFLDTAALRDQSAAPEEPPKPVSYATYLEEGIPYVTIAESGDSENIKLISSTEKYADNAPGTSEPTEDGTKNLDTSGRVLPSPTKITSEFRINTGYVNDNEPLVLKSNEVVQFRAPNFKTVATYPAYVNYYLKLNDDSLDRVIRGVGGKNTPAIPATMQTLLEFFQGGPAGYIPSDEWNPEISWQEKIDSLINSEKASENPGDSGGSGQSSKFMKEIFKTESDGTYLSSSDAEIATRADYQRNLEKYGTFFTKDVKYTYENKSENIVGTDTETGGPVYKATENEGKGRYHVFKVPMDKLGGEFDANSLFKIPASTTFYVVNFDATNYAAVAAWLQGTRSAVPPYRADVSTLPKDAFGKPVGIPSLLLDTEKLIQGVYSMGRSNLSKQPGHLVDTNHCEYKLLNSAPVDASLDELYIPRLWPETTEFHTMDGLGAEASICGIPANAEYSLREGEYLLFTYSSSEGREDDVAVTKNVAYGPGTIIKANFELIESSQLISKAPYTKTSDFGPWTLPTDKSVIASTEANGVIPGMFTLGAQEQIEIRERIQVVLDNATTLLYWELKDQQRDSDGYEHFPRGSYTLQPGEYVYYTDAAQESMAYYGSGTEIVVGPATPVIKRHYSNSKMSAEQINEVGLVSAIPWVSVNLAGQNASITINEYQYINLIEGDTLNYVSLKDSDKTKILTSEFVGVTAASYIAAGAAAELSTFLIEDCSWSACGRLELLMGPSTPQVLNIHQTSTGQEVARDLIYLWGHIGSDTESKENITQVYTPLIEAPTADEDSETGSGNTGDIEVPNINRTPIITVKVNKDGIPEDQNANDGITETWQQAYGQHLKLGEKYYTGNAIEDIFEIVYHTGTLDGESTVMFLTPKHESIVVGIDSDGQEVKCKVDLTGDYGYPVFIAEDGKVLPDDGIEIEFYLVASIPQNTRADSTGKSAVPLALFSSFTIMGSTGDVSFIDNATTGTLKKVSFKACKQGSLALSNGQIFAPEVGGPSQIPVGSDHTDPNSPVVTFNTLIPEDHFGLMSFYFQPTQETVEDDIYLVPTKDQSLAIFNYLGDPSVKVNDVNDYDSSQEIITKFKWWEDKQDGERYLLREGLNTVYIASSGAIQLFAPAASDAVILIDELKLIPKANIFNRQLSYSRVGNIFVLDSKCYKAVIASELGNGTYEDLIKELTENEELVKKLTAELDTLIANNSNEAGAKALELINAKRAVEELTKNEALTTKYFASKTIKDVQYNGLIIPDGLVLKRLNYFDPKQEFYYTEQYALNQGIELNDSDVSDTMMLAKNWFDKQNINNKFVISEIDVPTMEEFIKVSKTTRL